MSFFLPGFDPRADVVGKLSLVKIHGADGQDHRFILGADGVFTDVNGDRWVGSTLVKPSDLQTSIGGVAPSGTLTLTFFQDPNSSDDLVAQVRALGQDYIRDQPISFYVQPFTDHAQLYAPVLPPILHLTRVMKSIVFAASGPLVRSMGLNFETSFAGRNEARSWYFSTTDHAKLCGGANPSLSYMPLDDFQQEKLFG